ncbi:transposase [Mycobacterium tuberculosis variant bovis BCG]|nr:transposase [Mycobacterium tuberculosis variant bovis BCG]
MAKFEIPEGWMVQAFRFTLDPTAEQAARWHGISVPAARPTTGPSPP